MGKKRKKKKQATAEEEDAAIAAAKAQFDLYDAQVSEATAAFRKYDTDGSNSVDLNELSNLLKDLGFQLSDEQMKQYAMELYEEVDRDLVGNISLSEFIEFYGTVASRKQGQRGGRTRKGDTAATARGGA